MLQADFIRDVAVRCVDLLKAAGYSHPAGDDREIIRAYINVKHRRIQSRPRKVHKAPYSTPSHLTVGEQQLLEKVTVGDDLWPHQSRKIVDVSIEDGMLNDFGIQHFHLGTAPDPKHSNLIQGTKELLFAVVKDEDFYSLGIFDHQAWTKQALLDSMQTNWPELIAPYTFNSSSDNKIVGLSRNYTDDEIAQLRKARRNVLTQGADGSIRMGPGGGITTSGQSVAVTIEQNKFEEYVTELQHEIVAVLATNTPLEEIFLIWHEDIPLVITTPPTTPTNLSKLLNIPPL